MTLTANSKGGRLTVNKYLLAFILAQTTLIMSCATQSAATFYPNQNLSKEGLGFLKSETLRDIDSVHVLLEGEIPKCKYVIIGTILYDWTKDGVVTSKTTAIEGARQKAATIGASGIYQLIFEPSRISSSGSVSVGGVVGSSSVSVDEFGLKATAYFCMP